MRLVDPHLEIERAGGPRRNRSKCAANRASGECASSSAIKVAGARSRRAGVGAANKDAITGLVGGLRRQWIADRDACCRRSCGRIADDDTILNERTGDKFRIACSVDWIRNYAALLGNSQNR